MIPQALAVWCPFVAPAVKNVGPSYQSEKATTGGHRSYILEILDWSGFGWRYAVMDGPVRVVPASDDEDTATTNNCVE